MDWRSQILITIGKIIKLIGKGRSLITLILLFIGCLLITVAAIIGIPDNLPGILLCYFGIVAVILAFIHHWRRSKNFVPLLVASIVGFVVFAIFVCPAMFLIGLVGTLITRSLVNSLDPDMGIQRQMLSTAEVWIVDCLLYKTLTSMIPYNGF